MIAVFGGSFDPPHIGHANIIQTLLSYKLFEQIRLIPSKTQLLKDQSQTPISHRLNMLKLLQASNPKIKIDTYELDNHSPYTIDTLKALKKTKLIQSYASSWAATNWHNFTSGMTPCHLVSYAISSAYTGQGMTSKSHMI